MERDTPQRRAIRRVLEDADRPLSPQEALALARGLVSGIGLATVYRTLKTLVAEGWLVAVELPGQPDRYERAGKHHHHHFHCRSCGGVYEVEGCPQNLDGLTPPGFELQDHEIVLFGRCDRCADHEQTTIERPAAPWNPAPRTSKRSKAERPAIRGARRRSHR